MTQTEIYSTAQLLYPDTDFSEFGRLITFRYHHHPNYNLYAVVRKVYARGVTAHCLNWYGEEGKHFERLFYLDHMVSDIIDLSSGQILPYRAFYEQYLNLYHQDRKFGYSIPSHLDGQAQICFTGFSAKRKSELKAMAQSAGLWVTDDVRQHLEYLVCGNNAGPKKISKAEELGAALWNEQEFLAWLDSR